MKCPVDHTELQITERHGVELDYCPTCRGIWLDRGELDKLLERAQADEQQRYGASGYPAPDYKRKNDVPYEPPVYGDRPSSGYQYDDDDDDNDRHRGRRYEDPRRDEDNRRRRKRSVLEDIFDIFD